MKIKSKGNKIAGLYVLGSLYPYVTGGMEIFNYYFLNHQLNESNNSIFYLGEYRVNHSNGHFEHLKMLWPKRFFYPFQLFFAVFRLRKKLRFAYLSYAEQSWIITFAQSLTFRLFDVPYIITIHWGKEPDWKFSYPYKLFFGHAHAVIGVSEPICIAFEKAIPGREFIYIPPLIPFQVAVKEKEEIKKELGFNENDRILLFVGSLKPMKNPDKIVEAFRTLGRAFLNARNIRLVFAGYGEMDKELRERVEKYDLSGFIRFEGLISREIIPSYYKVADIYIISSDYEGTSLSLLEAMFNRLPIIGSNGPGINGMLRHDQNALLYETEDIDQLAETIKRIFSDSNLSARLADEAFADFKSQYSYETMIKKYESIFLST